MTTFNTGNPIGSAAAKDLYDNAENLDEFVNSDSKLSHPDRLGVDRKTWHGMEQDFQAFLANSGYTGTGVDGAIEDYVAGIEVTAYNQIIRESGEFWRLSAGTELPYTTTGAGMPEGGVFVSVGDAVLRQDLASGVASGQGGLLVSGSVIYVDTIADLQALPTSELVDGQQVQVKEYHAGTGVGGGEFYWDDGSTEDDNGGTVISVDGVASGRWKRVSSVTLTPHHFGAVENTDSTTEIQSFLDYIASSNWPSFSFSGHYVISEDLILEGAEDKNLTCGVLLTCSHSSSGAALTIRDSPYLGLPGRIEIVGGGGVTYSSRTNGSGVRVINSRRLMADFIKVSNFKYRGFDVEGGSGSNSSLGTINHLITIDCGSGKPGTVRGVSSDIVGRTDSGGSGSLTQRSAITVADLPTGVGVDDAVVIGGELSIITGILSDTEIEVFPWPPLGVSSGEVGFIMGGGFYSRLGDASNWYIGQHDAFGCSFGQRDLATYPATTSSFTSQACGVGIGVGRGVSGSFVAKSFVSTYFELNDFDLVKTTTVSGRVDIGLTTAFSSNDSLSISPRLSSGGISEISRRFQWLHLKNAQGSFNGRGVQNANNYTLNMAPSHGIVETVQSNNCTVSIAPPDLSDEFEFKDKIFFVVGTGARNRPTGTVTFTPPSGYTINGASSASYSSIPVVPMFYVRKESDTEFSVINISESFYTEEP